MSSSDKEMLEERLEEALGELDEKERRLERKQKRLNKLNKVKRVARMVVEECNRKRFRQLCETFDEDKNLYATNIESLWTGDLADINEKVQQLEEVLS